MWRVPNVLSTLQTWITRCNIASGINRSMFGPMRPSLQLQGIGPVSLSDNEPKTANVQSIHDIINDVLWFAAPKKRVTRSRRRIRTNNPQLKMKADSSIYQCPKCHAFKKMHVLLHCPCTNPDSCGLKNDSHVIRGPTCPKGVQSVRMQAHTWRYNDWGDCKESEDESA